MLRFPSFPNQKCATNEIQQTFFASLNEPTQVRGIFDWLPGVHFFMKDKQSRLMAVSKSIVERLGCKSEDEIIGQSDLDFFPAEIAEAFVRDDQLVFASAKPILNRTEVWLNDQRVLDWSLTNKLPLFDQEGHVCGLMGTVQSMDAKREMVDASGSISDAVKAIRNGYAKQLSISTLARTVGVSERQLRRLFQQLLGLSPQEFLLRTRLQAACDLLVESDDTILGIALDTGFSDHSSFTKHFRARLGIPPAEFRKRSRVNLLSSPQSPRL